jgi:GAF domain-containing protein
MQKSINNNFRRHLLRRSIDRMQQAQWTAQALKASTLEELLPQITRNATRLLRSPVCVLLLVQAENRLEVAATEGIHPDTEIDKSVSVMKSFSGRLIRRGQPMLIADVTGYLSESQKHLEPWYDGSFACTPLLFDKTIIGLINVCRPVSPSPLTRDDLALLISYGSQAAFAIATQRLVEKKTAQLQKARKELITANRRLRQDIDRRKRMGEALVRERDKLIQALAQVKTLRGLLPICASCKKIRDDQGYWKQIESYIQDHSNAEFSHGICPDCAMKLYPEIYEKTEDK